MKTGLAQLASKRLQTGKQSEIALLRQQMRAARIARDPREVFRIEKLLRELEPSRWPPSTPESRKALLEKFGRLLKQFEKRPVDSIDATPVLR